MSDDKLLQVSYNAFTDVLTVDGIGYSGGLFRAFGGPAPTGNWLRVLSRQDGVITVQSMGDDVQRELKRLEDALRSAECVVRQAARDTFGEDMTVKEFASASGYDS